MSSYGGGSWDGRAWAEGPPGAEGDYQQGYAQQPAAGAWPANYGQYPAGYDYSSYQATGSYVGYGYDPTYYQQSSEYYAKYGYQQPPTTSNTYNKTYQPPYHAPKRMSRSPVKCRDYKRRSLSKSLSPPRERSRAISDRKGHHRSRKSSRSGSSSSSGRSSRSRRHRRKRSTSSSSRSRSSSREWGKNYKSGTPQRKHMSKDKLDNHLSKSKNIKYSHCTDIENVKVKLEPKSPDRKKEHIKTKPINSTPPKTYKTKERSITPPRSYKIRQESKTPPLSSREHSTDSHRSSDRSIDSRKTPSRSRSHSSSRSTSPPGRTPIKSYSKNRSSTPSEGKHKKQRSTKHRKSPSKSKSRSKSRQRSPRRSRTPKKSKSLRKRSNSRSQSRSRSKSRSRSRVHGKSKRKSRSSSRELQKRKSRDRSRSKPRHRSRDRSRRRSRSSSRERREDKKLMPKSKSRSRSRSRSDSSSRGQFTGYDRKRYFKRLKALQKSPSPKETKPEPPFGAVEIEKVDDIQYSDPPDLDGVNFADLPPPPEQLFKKSNKPQVPLFIRNDGSFLEMFKKMQEVSKTTEASSSQAEVKPEIKKPALPFIGKRRGGRVLKTGLVKKAKAIDEQLVDNTPKDAWSLYMQEVKKYRETSCEEERKTRPLVK